MEQSWGVCLKEKERFIKKKRRKWANEVNMILWRKKEIKSKPIINKLSQKIAKEVGHEPIYHRYEKIVEAKKKK